MDIQLIHALYLSLRKSRSNYNANDYKWRLGAGVIREIERQYNLFVFNPSEKRTLYGIDVEIDYLNPYNIQLFEDITNTIAVDEKEG